MSRFICFDPEFEVRDCGREAGISQKGGCEIRNGISKVAMLGNSILTGTGSLNGLPPAFGWLLRSMRDHSRPLGTNARRDTLWKGSRAPRLHFKAWAGPKKEAVAMMQDNAGRMFIRAAMQAPYLERAQEHELARRWKEKADQQALHEITTAHMRLVIAMAAKFRHFGLPASDLIQEGHVGLLEAAARFEPERHVRFSTYATWWIRAAMQDYVLRNWSIVRGGTSSTQKALFFNLRRLRARLASGSEQVTNEELYRNVAIKLGVTETDVAMMDSRLSAPDSSLNTPLSDEAGGAERQDFLVDHKPLPDEVVGEAIDVERRSGWLRSALTALNERELRIIERRRLSDEGATLEELGATLGISKERVRQIEVRALEKLRAALAKQNPEFLARAA
jgi:RNA polymerase sigma-32 factor